MTTQKNCETHGLIDHSFDCLKCVAKRKEKLLGPFYSYSDCDICFEKEPTNDPDGQRVRYIDDLFVYCKKCKP